MLFRSEIDRDPGSRKQICEFPINKQDEIRRAYLIEGPYQPKKSCRTTEILSCACDCFSFGVFFFSIFLFLSGLKFRLNSQHVQVYDDI